MLHHSDWALLVVALVVIQLIYLKMVFPRRFEAFQRSAANIRPLLEYYRPGRIPFDVFIILRNLSFLGTLPLSITLLYRFSTNDQLNSGDWRIFLVIALAILIVTTLQRFILYFMGWLFRSTEGSHQQIFTKAFVLRWSTFVLLPINFVLVLLPQPSVIIAWLLGGLILLIYAWAIVRALASSLGKQPLRVGYLFYYLCGLEILPWLVVANHWEEVWRWSALTV